MEPLTQYQKHRQRYLLRQKIYNEEHREQIREYQRKYYQMHRSPRRFKPKEPKPPKESKLKPQKPEVNITDIINIIKQEPETQIISSSEEVKTSIYPRLEIERGPVVLTFD